LQDVEDGKIRVILDPAGPFSFDDDGVRDAMKLQNSKHAHGKVVIDIAADDHIKSHTSHETQAEAYAYRTQ